MSELILLFAGLGGLWIGTELLVRGATCLALRYRLSEFFIGVVVLSIGSDLPELAVAVKAGLQNRMGVDASGVVVGSSIGSAFSQIGLVMAILGLTGYVSVARRYIYQNGAVLLGSIILLALAGWDGQVTIFEGVALILAYLTYLVTLYKSESSVDTPQEIPHGKPAGYLFEIVFGMVVAVIASDVTVNAATSLAEHRTNPGVVVDSDQYCAWVVVI